jgi:putative ABC transport system permease protein
MLQDLFADAGFALRVMMKRPGFTAVVVLTLAIGIGANTAMFAALDAALFRSLPYEDPDRLVMGRATFSGGLNPMASAYDYFDYRERSDVFESLAAIAAFTRKSTITGGDQPEAIEGTYVAWDLFSTLGVSPQIGRHFLAEEGTAEGAGVVMISHGYWQRRFGGDPEVLGRVLTMNSRAHTIVGVMPAGFRFLLDADFWRPMWRDGPFAAARRWHNWLLVGRLRPDVPLRHAQSQVDVISAQLASEYPETNETKALQLDPLHSVLVESQRPSLLLLMTAVGLVLLIACGNVAGLLLARGATRRTEIAIRSAMGASRSRLLGQLVTESLLIALVAGAVGILLASWLLRLLPGLTRLDELGVAALRLDSSILLFALGVSMVTGLLFGVVPALRSTTGDVAADLKSGTRTSEAAGGTRLRSALVSAQVALTVILLVSSGLLIRSFTGLIGTNPGFETGNLLTAEIQLPGSEYDSAEKVFGFYEPVLEEVRAIPGVSAAGMVSMLPLRDTGNNIYVRPADREPATDQDSNVAFTRQVFPGYFEAMGIPLIVGRRFDRTDNSDRDPVLILNETMANRLFGDESPVGRQVIVDMGQEITFEVVGVVGDARLSWIGSEPRMAMYHSYYQIPGLTMRLAIRTAVEPASITGALREIVWRRDRNIPIEEIATMEALINDSVSSQKIMAGTLSAFSFVAMLLAAIGLYGVLAFYVSRRIREIGIRMALGAQRGSVMRLVLAHGYLLVGIGLVIGLAGAYGIATLIQGMLYGIGTIDPLSYAGMSLLFAAVALLACLLPAWRATRVDPVVALQAE